MSDIALSAAHWHEPPTPITAPAIPRFSFQLSAGVWTVVPSTGLAIGASAGELVDLASSGVFTLVPSGASPALARLKVAQHGGTTYVYR